MENEEKNRNLKEQKKHGKNRMMLVILFFILASLAFYVSFRGSYLEILEIGENYTQVFWQNLLYQSVAIGVNFVILFFAIYFTNRGIKKGLKPFFEQEKKEIPKLPNKSIAFVLAILISAFTSKFFTEKAMLFFSNAKFGIEDPIFNLDIGYFMFQKPFIEMILAYILILVIGLLIYSAIYYIVAFNVCFDGIDRQTLKQSKLMKSIFNGFKIISIIIGLTIILNTQNIVFDKMLTLQDEASTVLYGAGLTSSTIKLWGYILLAIVLVVSVFKAMGYLKRKQNKKAIIALAVVPSYLVILFVVMLGFQLIFVNPNELDKEKEYIAENIKNTKNAYNINIEEKEVTDNGNITEAQVDQYKEVLDNVALVSKDITLSTLKDKQTSSKYYSYRDTQIGKYNINGTNKLVYVSPREIVSGNNVTYNNKTYEYTHGNGAVITSATSTDKSGNMEYVQKSFDGSDNQIAISEPRIYFGMETNEPVVTNSKGKAEFDYPKSDSENAENTYEGKAGLKTNFMDRLILGIRQGDLKLAFSGDVTNESKILINRNIIQRVEKIMPYVMYDENPYQVITEDGRIVWVIDGYTTSNAYPYSQETIIERDSSKQRINYIRNSVKVLVDSYDGTVKFYITDRTDPIIMAYQNMYPNLFQSKEETIPADIAKHIVYPEYLYNIQANMLERYHNVKTDVLYRSSDVWDRATHTTSKTLKTVGTEIEPYYTMVKIIDSQQEQLGLVLPYTMYEKQSLISYLVGTCDEDINGKLTLYKYSADSNILGPMQLDTQIEQDEEISKALQTLNVTGTKLIRNMIIVPMDETLLYVEPIFQVMLNESEVPVLRKVIVASGNKVAIGNNLTEALKNLTSQSAINIEVSNTDSVEDLVNAIVKANQNLDNSKQNGDWEMMGKDMSTLQDLIKQLEELLRVQEEEKKENEEQLREENTVNHIENVVENIIENVNS